MLALPMPVQTPFTGSGYNEALGAATAAAAPFEQKQQQLKTDSDRLTQMGKDEETKQKAIAYRQLLHRGADGMRQYAAGVADEFPDLGNQLGAEADQYATFLQDPSLTGEKAEEYAHHFYESANNRYKVLKDAKAPPAPKPWAPASMDEAVAFDRSKRENEADFRAPPKPNAADQARTAKRMKALRELPTVWAQIEDMVRGNVALPETDTPIKLDAIDYANAQTPEWQSALVNSISRSKAQGAKYSDLRKRLGELEATAGLQATPSILGEPMLNSDSYKLYKTVIGRGSGAPAPAAPPKPAPQAAVDGALQWIKDVKSGKIKDEKTKDYPNGHMAHILIEVRKAGIDTSGL